MALIGASAHLVAQEGCIPLFLDLEREREWRQRRQRAGDGDLDKRQCQCQETVSVSVVMAWLVHWRRGGKRQKRSATGEEGGDR